MAVDQITYSDPCNVCGARTEHRGNVSTVTHGMNCRNQYVGPEGAYLRAAREKREAQRARFTVAIVWGWGGVSGEVEVVIEAPSASSALAVALAHNVTRVISEGGAGISSHTVRYTPNAELTEEEEFDGE